MAYKSDNTLTMRLLSQAVPAERKSFSWLSLLIDLDGIRERPKVR
jgi:hypothetical protein